MKSITYSEKLEVRFRLENTKKPYLYKINLVLTYKISIILGIMNKNKRRRMIWEALYRPVQEPKKEMIYNAPQSHYVLIEESCEHCGFPKEECTGYKCWIK